MNDSSCSRWSQFVSAARGRWPELTDDDFHACRVDRSKLVNKLQQVYGMSPAAALQGICEVERSLNRTLCDDVEDFDLDNLGSAVFNGR